MIINYNLKSVEGMIYIIEQGILEHLGFKYCPPISIINAEYIDKKWFIENVEYGDKVIAIDCKFSFEETKNIDKLKEDLFKIRADLLYEEKLKSYKPCEEVPKNILKVMKTIDEYAEKNTTDPKIYVGAGLGYIEDNRFILKAVGCNCNEDYNEKMLGHTYREYMFNSRDKKYRPWDKIIHAEENCINNAMKQCVLNKCNVAVVTRYPCEKCAELLVYKGIKRVYYGRKFKVSEGTKRIFLENDVELVHVSDYVGDERDDNL